MLGAEDRPVGVLDLGLHPGRDLRKYVPASVNKTALPECPGVGLLDRGDQPGRPVGDDQQRAGQATVLEILEEAVPGVGGLAGAGRQADERRLAFGGDAPGSQHRLGRGARVHPEEGGVQEEVVQDDVVQAASRPPWYW